MTTIGFNAGLNVDNNLTTNLLESFSALSDQCRDKDVVGQEATYQNLHQSVLLKEILENLNIQPDQIYIDATFGLGGYSAAILAHNPYTRVIAVDQDPQAQHYANQLIEKYGKRFQFITGRFSQLSYLLGSYHHQIAGLVFDLGVSSPQLDQADRGFSFRFDGPLDMRMGSQALTAADIVNTYSDKQLLNIIRTYGEENFAKQIVKALIAARSLKPITTTLGLSAIIEKVVPRFLQKIHPATRTFQALRIAVNDELGELKSGLEASLNLLNNCGRLVVVSFHSLEDRIVKQFIQNRSTAPAINRFSPQVNNIQFDFKKITRKAVTASEKEIKMNPRARSAKLRTAERLNYRTDRHE